jgi:hypothetical protein
MALVSFGLGFRIGPPAARLPAPGSAAQGSGPAEQEKTDVFTEGAQLRDQELQSLHEAYQEVTAGGKQ